MAVGAGIRSNPGRRNLANLIENSGVSKAVYARAFEMMTGRAAEVQPSTDGRTDYQAAARRRAGDDWHDTGYVFTTRSGLPVEPRNLARSFARLVEAAGLRPIRLHDLRHTMASLLKKLRTAPNDAKEILGHARISTTMEVYTHGDEEDQRSALDRMADVLFSDPEA